MRKGGFSFVFFLLGLGSHLQIYLGGAIGLSEIFVFAAAPFLFAKNFALLRKDGFMPLLTLSLLSLLGCAMSCLLNNVPYVNAIRGHMANYALFASIVTMHHFLRKDLNGYKWCLLGVALSWLLSTFIFQQATEVYMYSKSGINADRVADIMSGPLFWAGRLGGFWVLPYQGWYLQIPMIWNIILPTVWAVVSIMISEGSGRSMALVLLGATYIIAMCRKSPARIQKVMRGMPIFLVVAMVGISIFSAVYSYTAARGMLGEKALVKYEKQVRGTKSPLAILMAGRSEFFVGLYACLRKPILGYGPWPLDKEYIYEDWLDKYGTAESVESYYKYKNDMVRSGYGERLHLIPSHSVLIQFWLWYGIFGLFLWLYVLRSIWRYIRYDMDAIPQYIGFLAAAVPSHLWNIFFSPFAGRLEYGLFLSAILLTHVVKQGKLSLPMHMQHEIFKNMK